jgi:peptide/nickel transport system substrate-binding protein
MWKLTGALAVLEMLLVSCTSGAPATPPPGGAVTQPASGPRTLQIGILSKEPNAGIALFSTGATGAREPAYALHAGMSVYDDKGELQPRLASKIPAIGDDWVLLPDGSMEVTWKLRPNLTWNDGAPLTADDFVFGMQVYQDKDVPLAQPSQIRLISEVTAPDLQTVVVHWKQAYSDANVGGIFELPAVPRHLISDLYQRGDKQAFINSPYWSHEFVGAGPYKLGQWLSGSYLEALASDSYVLGRPKIDRLVFNYYGDINTLVVSLLSGHVDVAPVGSLELENGAAIKEAWDPTGGGTVLSLPNHFHHILLTMRDPSAPWAKDPRVREAMLHLQDRQSLVDSLLVGLTTVADLPLAPDDHVIPLVRRLGVPTPTYDLNEAQRLLAQAGWTKGPDGMERNAAGQPFTIQFVEAGAADSIDAREGLVIVDWWKAGGLDASPVTFALDDVNIDQKRATVNGGAGRGTVVTPSLILSSFTTAQIASDQNRWRGSNRPGYSNPAFDRLFDEWSGTIDARDRDQQVAEMIKLLADDVAYLPLYYSPDVMAFRKGVRGPGNAPAAQVINAWNVHTWEMD